MPSSIMLFCIMFFVDRQEGPPRLSGARPSVPFVPETAGHAGAAQEKGGPRLITAADLLGG